MRNSWLTRAAQVHRERAGDCGFIREPSPHRLQSHARGLAIHRPSHVWPRLQHPRPAGSLSLSLFRNRYSMSYNMQHWLIRCQVQPEWVMQVCTLRSLATLSRVELPYRVAYIRSSILFLDLFLNLLLY